MNIYLTQFIFIILFLLNSIAFSQEVKRDNINQITQNHNFDNEQALNALAYDYLNHEKIKDAIEIFKLNVTRFPNSANVYDSLAEALMINGDKDLALINYEKSLALNPENSHAAKEIDALKYPKIDKTKFSKIYSKQQYLEDIDEFAHRLVTVNPNAYKYILKEKFWENVTEKKEKINSKKEPTTYAEFIWDLSEIIANINCGHTALGYFNQEDEILPIELRFPLDTRLINGKLYVLDGLVNGEKVKAGAEIVSINGIKINELMADILKHIVSQGFIVSAKKEMFNHYNTAYIPYSLGFPKHYQIKIKDRDSVIKLKNLTEYQPKPLINPKSPCQENLCLSFNDDKQTAVLTIHDFAYYGSRFKTYKSFIDKSFKEINAKGSKNLIIDVRLNGGGPSDAGIHLLRYLASKRFTYFSRSAFNEKKEPIDPFESRFKGKTYILIDGNGFSTTGHFVSLARQLKIATIIGEELGSNEFSTAGQNVFRTKNTEIFYMVGRYTYITASNSVIDKRGIMPDYCVTPSINDYINNVDAVMAFTLNLIESKN